VRSPTATKILLGTIGTMAVLILAIEGGREALPLVLVFATVAGLLYAAYRIREVPRRDAFRDTARSLGLHHEVRDTRNLGGLPHPLLHRLAETRDIVNVLTGTWRGLDVVAFEYRYTSGTDARGQSQAFTYLCVLTPVPASWPDLVVEPERLPTKLADTLALRDIDMELETFNRAFEIRSTDPRFASAFLDARMMAWLMESAPVGFGAEIVGGQLLTFVPDLLPWQVDTVLAATVGFLEQVPPVIASLYPDPATP
jgi:hypothetical protein